MACFILDFRRMDDERAEPGRKEDGRSFYGQSIAGNRSAHSDPVVPNTGAAHLPKEPESSQILAGGWISKTFEKSLSLYRRTEHFHVRGQNRP